MGHGSSTSLKNMPMDLSKCTDEQLRFLIDTAIASNPWYSDKELQVSKKNSKQNFSIRLESTVEAMKERGFRPISPSEYRQELFNNKKFDISSTSIKLWKSLSEDLKLKNVYYDPDLGSFIRLDVDNNNKLPCDQNTLSELTDEWAVSFDVRNNEEYDDFSDTHTEEYACFRKEIEI